MMKFYIERQTGTERVSIGDSSDPFHISSIGSRAASLVVYQILPPETHIRDVIGRLNGSQSTDPQADWATTVDTSHFKRWPTTNKLVSHD